MKLRYKLDVYPAVILVVMNLKACLGYTDLFRRHTQEVYTVVM